MFPWQELKTLASYSYPQFLNHTEKEFGYFLAIIRTIVKMATTCSAVSVVLEKTLFSQWKEMRKEDYLVHIFSLDNFLKYVS